MKTIVSFASMVFFLAFGFISNPSFSQSSSVENTDQYIVIFKSNMENVRSTVELLTQQFNSSPDAIFEYAIKGFSAKLSKSAVLSIRNNQLVNYVEIDSGMKVSQEIPLPRLDTSLSWGLDRIDQRTSILDNEYNFNYTASNVYAFVIDSGIRAHHQEFSGRVLSGLDLTGEGPATEDCRGHGTFVAGIIGGNALGVAKKVKLIPVRILDCQGRGSYTNVLIALDRAAATSIRPAVANLSFTGNRMMSINDAIAGMVKRGIVVVTAAGNSNMNACNYSPSSAPHAITVGATLSNDAKLNSSNYGSCVDIFAPGSDIVSSWNANENSFRILSGTSMAAAHVSGVVALALAANPSASPSAIKNFILQNSTKSVVSGINSWTPNRLAYSLGKGEAVEPSFVSISEIISKRDKFSAARWKPSALIKISGTDNSVLPGVIVSAMFSPGGETFCTTNYKGECTVTGATLSSAHSFSSLEVVRLNSEKSIYEPLNNKVSTTVTIFQN